MFQAYYQQYTKILLTDIRSLAKNCTLTAKYFDQTNKITAKDLQKARHRLPLGPQPIIFVLNLLAAKDLRTAWHR